MPDIARWNGIDQLAESYLSTSTYAYVAGNPVSYADVDGRWFNADGTIDTSGKTPYFTSGRQMYNSFLGIKPGDGGGGGYSFSGNSAGSMFNYFANGGSIDGISFNKGFAMWSTMDDSNRKMYYDEDDMLTGNSGGMTLHRAKVDDTPWEAVVNWTDWGSTAMGGGFEYVANQRGRFYTNGQWVDNLGTVRSVAYAGRGGNSLIGLRSDYLRTTAMYVKYAKRLGWVGNAISAGQIGYGVYEDKGNFGENAQVATAGVAGGMAGAAVGAWLGAKILGPVGGAIGVAFFGVGAAPGIAIGGAVGGVIGGILGGVYGGDYAEGKMEEWLK